LLFCVTTFATDGQTDLTFKLCDEKHLFEVFALLSRQDLYSDIRETKFFKSNMSQNTSSQVRSSYTGGDTSEVRSVREEQLGVIGRDILKRSMSIQRDLYEERIQELEDEISRLKEVKKGSFQVWLRIRPSLDCKRLVSSSFRRTNVTIDQNLYRVHHVFGPESADEPSTSKPVDAHLASNTEVWEKWDKQVQAAV
jgi:hypothetical protein